MCIIRRIYREVFIFQIICKKSIKRLTIICAGSTIKEIEESILKKGAEHMLENTMILLTVMLLLILTVGFVWYMRGRVDSRDYVFHKIWYLFRYAALKPEIGAGYGIMALESFGKNRRKEEGSRYPVVDVRQNRLQMKEWKLKEMREEHFSTGQKKELYNLKILK